MTDPTGFDDPGFQAVLTILAEANDALEADLDDGVSLTEAMAHYEEILAAYGVPIGAENGE